MTTIVTRVGKGSPLTTTEVDANFTNLNNDKIETSAAGTTGLAVLGATTSGEARTTLDVFSKTESIDTAIAMAIALG